MHGDALQIAQKEKTKNKMKYLVRIYHTNKDKQNEQTNSFGDALKYIGKKESEIYQRVNWLHYTDLFFIGTSNYIRVNNNL